MKILGKWYVHFTDFNMWLRGDKLYPTFTYTKENDRILDEVSYMKKGRVKTILGYDKVLDNGSFIWRGKGILKPLYSEWFIDYVSEDGSWMLIYFKPTLLTQEGYDIIAKDEVLSKETLDDILFLLSEMDLDLGRIR